MRGRACARHPFQHARLAVIVEGGDRVAQLVDDIGELAARMKGEMPRPRAWRHGGRRRIIGAQDLRLGIEATRAAEAEGRDVIEAVMEASR